MKPLPDMKEIQQEIIPNANEDLFHPPQSPHSLRRLSAAGRTVRIATALPRSGFGRLLRITHLQQTR
jgi:hypothetical protein